MVHKMQIICHGEKTGLKKKSLKDEKVKHKQINETQI